MALQSFWRKAILFGHVSATRRLLQEETEISTLETGLRIAIRYNHLDILSSTIAKLLDKSIIIPEKVELVTDTDGQLRHRLAPRASGNQRLEVLASPLVIALRGQKKSVTELLMPAYLKCLAEVPLYCREHPARAVCDCLTDQELTIRDALFHRLQDIGERDSVETILVRTGRTDFHVPRDILCYQSKYFAALFRDVSDWADRNLVDFGDHISAKIMLLIWKH
ncbi:uncharacterized protein BDV17DRAFT_289961 [Aspergillus undulatus]|uniref:uncharacterized protein n=1 Tax=Aspergillus undulatus TaxID=1810928 RepID=UPI003CCDD34B